MWKVGVKFCGNCNPQINGPRLIEALKSSLPDVEFLSYDKPGLNVLLIVSGCPVDCATRPTVEGPVIVVAGASIDRIPCEIPELKKAVKEKIEKLTRRNWE